MTQSPPEITRSAPGAASGVARRQRWMAALARASAARLEEAWSTLTAPPTSHIVRAPEVGTAMVRARAGGSGDPFHLGEMTITRCAVSIPAGDGTPLIGQGYVAGRNKRHAELAALFDALLQDPDRHDVVDRTVIRPLVEEQEARQRETRARAAATRVDFFTLVRGD